MSNVIRDEVARLTAEKVKLTADVTLFREQETTLHRQREEVLKKVRTTNWELSRVEKQIEKLDEFLEMEKWYADI